MVRNLKCALVILAGVVGLWGVYALWQNVARLPLERAKILHVNLTARPATRPGFNVIAVELGTPGSSSGEVELRLRMPAREQMPPATAGVSGRQVQGSCPISVVDLGKVAGRTGLLGAWEIIADAPGPTCLKIWRWQSDLWTVVGESAIEQALTGNNYFSLNPPLAIHEGDYLGYYTAWNPGLFPVRLYGWDFTGKLYAPGNFHGAIPQEKLFRDAVGNYQLRVLYAPIEPGKELVRTLKLKPGRAVYRLELPAQAWDLTGAEFSVDIKGGARVFLYPALLNIFQGQGIYVGLDYDSSLAMDDAHAKVVPVKWPLNDALLILMAMLGLGLTLRLKGGRWHLIVLILLVIAASGIWARVLSAGPGASLVLAGITLFILPGFLMLEIGFPRLARDIDALERGPLLFGISMGMWTMIAAVAYRAHWLADDVIGAILMVLLLGLTGLFFVRKHVPVPPELPGTLKQPLPFQPVYLVILAVVLITVAGAVGFSAQFQRADFDTIDHLAGYRKVSDSAMITGGNCFLEPGHCCAPHYAANPWYLVVGLTARLAHADIIWLYVILAGAMTVLMFGTFYFLLKALTRDHLIALIGTMLSVVPWIYELAIDWKEANNCYLQFFPYPYTLAQLILFPLMTACCLRYSSGRDRQFAVITLILAAAVMGQHVVFVIWAPCIIGAALLAGWFWRQGRRDWQWAIGLIAATVVLAGIIGYLMVSFPLAGSMAPKSKEWTMAIVAMKGMRIFNESLYCANPDYIVSRGWKEVLALVVIAGFVLFQDRGIKQGHGAASLPVKYLSFSWGPLIAAAGVLFIPWLIIFNPVVVPWIIKPLGWPQLVYRFPAANTVLSHAFVFGAIACGLILFSRQASRAWRGFRLIPLIAIFIGIGAPFVVPSSRIILRDVWKNRGWYPSLLDLSRDSLYSGLARLEPGVVAVAREKTGLVAALTPHYLVMGNYNQGNSVVTAEDERFLNARWVDNEKIVAFRIPPAEMTRLLNKYRCRYVIVARGSAALSVFRAHPELFDETLITGTDVVFAVKNCKR